MYSHYRLEEQFTCDVSISTSTISRETSQFLLLYFFSRKRKCLESAVVNLRTLKISGLIVKGTKQLFVWPNRDEIHEYANICHYRH